MSDETIESRFDDCAVCGKECDGRCESRGNSMTRDIYDFTVDQRDHAPRAVREAFERLLCADRGGADHICAMYDGHQRDLIRSYRNEHHCECGHVWSETA